MVRESELAEMEKKWAEENARIMREFPPGDTPTAALPAPIADVEDAPAELTVAARHDRSGGGAGRRSTCPRDAAGYVRSARKPRRAARSAGRIRPAQEAGKARGVNDIDDTKAPLLDHLIELRKRLLWSIAALVAAFGACLYFARPILAFLVAPLKVAGQTKIINTEVFGGFLVEVKVAFFAGMMLSFPVIANQLWQFIAPGLYRQEKRALLPFLLATPVLFVAGAAMAYFIAMPMALKFLLGFRATWAG